ncbi:MAG TPA: BTAD domain-containing putative transcriptional regulator, partial [Gaiellaceae bacterium]|nr:BTAD domain-containing putative transcriptional regulator [Gaiellaceae bacterium]
MTRGDHVLEFRVLGPLEASVDGEALQLGSAKQRTVLATLLVSAGEIVPAERIVDELWGESPPASAEHTVTVYISRIRRLLNGYGPVLARRGEGYVLELAEGALDSRAFGDSAAAVARATAAGDHELAVRQGREGLSLWRGSVLADVSLGPQARAAAERLEELRLHVSELVVEAELALGRHERVVGELQTLVDRNPYRERFIAQLMLALYRSGRQVEALEVYERTRRRLDDDLALQPSADLQHLSAQIVRQERTLRAPSELSTGGRSRAAGHDARRASLVAGVAAAVVAAMTLAAAGSTPQSAVASDADATRVALVLQRGSTVSAFPSSRSHDLADALFDASAQSGYEAQLIELPDEVTREGVARAATVLADEEVDLVLFGLNATTAAAFAPVARGLGDGRAVFIDASMRKLGLEGVANVSAITFATEQTAQLAGALSGLVAPRGAPAGRHVDAVSVVAGL